MTRYISRAQLARELKVSRASITSAIRAGRISGNAMTADGAWLDADRAAEQFRATSSRNHPPALPRPAWSRAPAAPTPTSAPEPTAPSTPERAESLARRDAAKAALAELEQLQRSGQLVSADQVQAEAFRLARETRDRILQVPDRVAPQVAAADDPRIVHALLSAELREALRQLATEPDTPDRAESLARRDAARAQLAEMQAKERAGELISAEAARATWASVAGIVKTALMAVPSKAKQEIPRLTLEEVGILEELIREALEEVAGGDVRECAEP